MKTEIIKKIIYSHFAGVASPLQTQLLRDWLKSNEHQELYYIWLQEWEQLHPQMIVNADQGYRALQQKMDASITNLDVEVKQPRITWQRALVASCWAGIFLLSAYTLRNYWYQKVYTTSKNETIHISLPDGSLVKLYPSSKLTFTRFQSLYQARVVQLSGDADFKVMHLTDGKKFIVSLPNNLSIEVLGTEFTVNSNQNETDVSLKTGKIRLGYHSNEANKEVYMEPGDHLRYSHSSRSFNKLSSSITIKQEEKEWILSEVSLEKLSHMIESKFDVKVSFRNKQIAQMTVSGIVPTNNLDELLQSLSVTLNLKIERKKNNIQIH